ncbi:MAG: 30S ribosomal protein S8 [Zetaproteobacteria bacterium]|nr:MAG: 30S ribosomal protein S8 [Zetaproteobacteria bacterium]
MMTDPIADMLARIRNAQMAGLETTEVPASNLKIAIAKILEREGYIEKARVRTQKGKRVLEIRLRYDEARRPAIKEIVRVSKPGRRVYAGVDELPRVKRGYGIAIVSTSKGVMTDREARRQRVGGEILCTVF